MSQLYYPTVGEKGMLTDGISGDNTWTARLYVNDITPAASDTAATYTEASFTGYTSAAFSRDGAMSVDGAGNAVQAYAKMTFSFTGSSGTNNVYGWYFTDGAGALRAAERFDSAPWVVDVGHPEIDVTPLIQLHTA